MHRNIISSLKQIQVSFRWNLRHII